MTAPFLSCHSDNWWAYFPVAPGNDEIVSKHSFSGGRRVLHHSGWGRHHHLCCVAITGGYGRRCSVQHRVGEIGVHPSFLQGCVLSILWNSASVVDYLLTLDVLKDWLSDAPCWQTHLNKDGSASYEPQHDEYKKDQWFAGWGHRSSAHPA